MLRIRILLYLSLLLGSTWSMVAQQLPTTPREAVVPTLVRFSGSLNDNTGKPLSGTVGVTFSLYKDQQGGAPLWVETQNVQGDKNGHYTVMLGASKSTGLPTDVFVSGEARWVGVEAQGQAEQPRALLLSVPYALKAGDAQTIGGLPASAFVLAAAPNSGSASSSSSGASGGPGPLTVGGGGTTDFIPLWTSSSNLGNSVLFQSGSGSTAKVGINTTTPASTLDVKGGSTIRGLLSLPAKGTATATTDYNSQPMDLAASVFNGGTNTPVTQTFQWQAEPVNNDKNNASGTLNLLFASGTGKPAETGLNIASNGQITFASGQTFPGSGSITGVTAGTDLTGGGNNGNVTLNVDTTKVPQLGAANTFTANQSVNGTVSATAFSGDGSKLTNVNASQLGGQNASAFAQLGVANTFTADQKVNGNIAATNINASGAFRVQAANWDGYVIYAENTAPTGSSTTGIAAYSDSDDSGSLGVWGESLSATGAVAGVEGYIGSVNGSAQGVLGYSSATTGGAEGVTGWTISPAGIGVLGVDAGASNTGAGSGGAGVWGDTGQSGNIGVLATADDGHALHAVNNSSFNTTLYLQNNETTLSTAPVLWTYGKSFGGICSFDVSGNFSCTGTKSAVVPVDNGSRKVALYAVEAPENWFEDAGSGNLSNGEAVVNLEGTFSQTVNTEMDYKVFLTPNGDCKGLYVAQKSPSSFVVRELGDGTSSIAFDYRIMAKRKGFENIRLADKTKDFDPAQQMGKQQTRAVSRTPIAPKPLKRMSLAHAPIPASAHR